MVWCSVRCGTEEPSRRWPGPPARCHLAGSATPEGVIRRLPVVPRSCQGEFAAPGGTGKRVCRAGSAVLGEAVQVRLVPAGGKRAGSRNRQT